MNAQLIGGQDDGLELEISGGSVIRTQIPPPISAYWNAGAEVEVGSRYNVYVEILNGKLFYRGRE